MLPGPGEGRPPAMRGIFVGVAEGWALSRSDEIDAMDRTAGAGEAVMGVKPDLAILDD